MKAFFFCIFFIATSVLAESTQSHPRDSFEDNCAKGAIGIDFFPEDASLSSLKSNIEDKAQTLGLKILWKTHTSGGSWETFKNNSQDRARLKRIANFTFNALAFYPSELFAKVDLKIIYLAKDLNVGGQLRKAMPDPEGRSLVYADNDDLLCDSGMSLRVHHEFYHYIESRITGSMFNHDASWTKLNPPDFIYGKGGSTAYNAPGGFKNTGHVKDGFISRYSELAEEEDKAETFGWMMTQGYGPQMEGWAKTDPVLKQKRDWMIQFFQKITPKMDPDFFQAFAQE
jgi:hypothetical protein